MQQINRDLDRVIELGSVSAGTAKKVIRDFRSRNGVTATPRGTSIKNRSWLEGMMDAMAGPHFNPGSKSVFVPRGIAARSPDRVSRLVGDPVGISIHEHAHSLDGMNGRRFLKRDGISGEGDTLIPALRIDLRRERRTNRAALKSIQKHGSESDISGWKKFANNQMHTGYRNPAFQKLSGELGADTLGKKKQLLRDNKWLQRGSTSLSDNSSSVEFSLLAGAAVGAGAHVASNALFKRMLTPGTMSQRIGSSIFQAGVRHAKTGQQVHPFIRGAVNALAGPELGHLYEAGLKSNRIARKSMALAGDSVKHIADQATDIAGQRSANLGKGMAGIVTGKRSGFMSKVMSWLPKSKGHSRAADVAGTAIAGIGSGLLDPIYPAVNIARTAISKTSLGNKVLGNAFQKGADHGPMEGLSRHLSDLVVSPSMNIARDAGATLHNPLQKLDKLKALRSSAPFSKLPAMQAA